MGRRHDAGSDGQGRLSVDSSGKRRRRGRRRRKRRWVPRTRDELHVPLVPGVPRVAGPAVGRAGHHRSRRAVDGDRRRLRHPAGPWPQFEEPVALRGVDRVGRRRAQHAGAVPDLHGVFRPGLARHLRRLVPGAPDRDCVQQCGLPRGNLPRRPARGAAHADARGTLARHERARGVPAGRAAAAFPDGLPSDDEPDGLGHPDDFAGGDRGREHRPRGRHAGAQRPHVPHVRILRAWRR